MKCPLSRIFESDKCPNESKTTIVNSSAEEIRRLESDLARIQVWMGNCDQKASFLLATIGILLALFLSTDAVVDSIALVKESLILACTNCQCGFVLLWSLASLLIGGSFVCSAASIFYLLLALRSDIDDDKYQEAKNSKPSFTFFGSISKRSYRDYCNNSQGSSNEYIDELKSQIYINAKICTRKFENFKTGNTIFRFDLFLIIFSVILLLILHSPNNG